MTGDYIQKSDSELILTTRRVDEDNVKLSGAGQRLQSKITVVKEHFFFFFFKDNRVLTKKKKRQRRGRERRPFGPRRGRKSLRGESVKNRRDCKHCQCSAAAHVPNGCILLAYVFETSQKKQTKLAATKELTDKVRNERKHHFR